MACVVIFINSNLGHKIGGYEGMFHMIKCTFFPLMTELCNVNKEGKFNHMSVLFRHS